MAILVGLEFGHQLCGGHVLWKAFDCRHQGQARVQAAQDTGHGWQSRPYSSGR